MESIKKLEQMDIQRKVNEWNTNLILNLYSINFKIKNDFDIYDSSFNLTYLNTLLSSNYLMNVMIDCLLSYIDVIEEKEKYIKLNILNKE